MILRLLAVLLALGIPGLAHGQSPAPADEEDAAAAPAAPAEASQDDNIITRIRAWARGIQLRDRLNGAVDGWYPRFGGITRGAGFAAGPGYRGSLLDDSLFLDVSGAFSTKGYKSLDAQTRWLQAWNRRFELWTEVRYEDFPQEDFFGTGMSSRLSMRTSYDFDSTEALARAVIAPQPWLRITGTAGVLRPDVGSGADEGYPSIEERFDDGAAPGIVHQSDFLHGTVAAEIDTRDRPGNPASGGFYRTSYGAWNDVERDRFDFDQFEVQLMHFVPLTRARSHVMSGRAGARSVHERDGHRVPFYFLAHVGGADTIRSFREFRFKDENTVWLSAEYKWLPRSFLSVAVFADAGQAGSELRDLAWRRMRSGYGVGIGLHTDTQTLVRLDVATGAGEGWQYFLKIRPGF